MALRVLVVDDVASMRRLFKAWFDSSDLDAEVEEAASGEEAIALLDRQRFDVVLTDHRMGAVSGIDVLVYALEHQPDAMRCMMTGYADAELAAAAYTKAKAHLFMEKDIRMDEIMARLERELASRLHLAAPGERV